jgi:hypothetical protein
MSRLGDAARTRRLQREAQDARERAEAAGEPFADYVPWPKGEKPAELDEVPADVTPTSVALFSRPVDDVAALIHLVPPAKLALGARKTKDGAYSMVDGGLGPGWRFATRHGMGYDPASGRIGESVALHLEHPDGRSGLFVWARQVPHPVVLLAALVAPSRLGRTGPRHADYMPPLWWPTLAAVLAQLPTPSWKTAGTWRWTRRPDGRPDDTPRRTPSPDLKKEIRR